MCSHLLARACLLASTYPIMMRSDRFVLLESLNCTITKMWITISKIFQDEGFKNVSLGNVLSASYGGTKKNTFVSDADNDLLKKYKVRL